MKKSVAIITARGGSKRIPRKNIRLFHGKPIISYPIEAALASGCFELVMVSTDDEEIANISRACGAEVPFFRSSENSSDAATTAAVLREVVQCFDKVGLTFDLICSIVPTSPFLTPEKLRAGRKLLEASSGFDSVATVTRFSYPIQRAFRIEGQCLKFMWPENEFVSSSSLEPTYHDAGQFYWLRREDFLQSGKVFGNNCAAIPLDESEVQDIDHEEDWKVAEIKFEAMLKNRIKS